MKILEGNIDTTNLPLTEGEISLVLRICKGPRHHWYISYHPRAHALYVREECGTVSRMMLSLPSLNQVDIDVDIDYVHLLVKRGLLVRRYLTSIEPGTIKRENLKGKPVLINEIQYHLQPEKLKDFEQLKELRVQLALGSLNQKGNDEEN